MTTCPTSDALEYHGRFTAKGKPNGNERILWHGTRRSCNLGETGQTTPCMFPRCSVCSAILGLSGSGKVAADTPPGRFGGGIYTFSKALKYVLSGGPTITVKKMDADLHKLFVEPTIIPPTTRTWRHPGWH